MALANTTLASACAATDNNVVVTSATSYAAGLYLLCDNELMQITKGYVSGTTIPVQRGQDGTIAAAHPITANIELFILPSDLPNPAPGTGVVAPIAARPRLVTSYTAAAAWTPQAGLGDELVILNGTSVVALTIVNPTKDQDGKLVTFAGNGKAAHTVTYTTTGFGNIGSTADVITFHATMAQSFQMIAIGGFWNLIGQVAGAASVAGVGLG